MKKLLTLITLGLTCFGVTACKKKDKGFKPKYDKNTSCKINITGHYDNFEALEDEFIRFNKYYPNVQLTYTKMDNYKKMIGTSLKSDDAPDIFFSFPYMIGDSAYDDVFNACEDFSSTNLGFDLSNIRDGLLFKDNEKHTYMVPIYTNTYGMLINENLFKEKNINIPTTYNEFLDACRKFKEAGISNPTMAYSSDKDLALYAMFYPYFCAQIKDNADAIKKVNDLSAEGGEYLRSSLTLIKDFMDKGYMNLDECKALKNDYEAVILRFYEGDIPMMLTTANTVSGTEKREAKSENFKAHPFKYSFHPVPTTETGGFYLTTVSLAFSVNKNSKNLKMVNEFMRFILQTEELGNMGKIKRLITPTVDMSLDDIYSSFGTVTPIYTSEIGLTTEADQRVRTAGLKVCNGILSIDEAIEGFYKKE